MASFLTSLHFSATSSAENDAKIVNAGRINEKTLKVSIGVLFIVAAVAVIARIVTRIWSRHRLCLDDGFLIWAFICLCCATGLLYLVIPVYMVEEAIVVDPTVVAPMDQICNLLNSISYMIAFVGLVWTCIFSVKLAFLVLFWILIRRVSKPLTRYYWFVVGFTIITWMFFMGEPFLLYRHSGVDQVNSYANGFSKTLAFTALTSGLDIVSDIMSRFITNESFSQANFSPVISIPLIVIQKTQMKWTKRLSLLVFLCLSVVMVIITLIRVASLRVGSRVDLIWANYWAYVEACISCIMVSMSAFRTLFVKSDSRPLKKKPRGQYCLARKLLLRKTRLNRFDLEGIDVDYESLPQIPSATLSGVRTFIRSNNRSAGAAIVTISAMDPLDEDIMTQSRRYIRSTTSDQIRPENTQT